jgi:hypothetical protein
VLRGTVLELLGGEEQAPQRLANIFGPGPELWRLAQDLHEARTRLTPEAAARARRAADRQILPEPTDVRVLQDLLEPAFHGQVVVDTSEC